MQVVTKDNIVIATHEDGQDLTGKYPDCVIFQDDNFIPSKIDIQNIKDFKTRRIAKPQTYLPTIEEYNAKVLEQKAITKKAEILAQISELEIKQFRSAKAKFSGTATDEDLEKYNNYENQIMALRVEL